MTENDILSRNLRRAVTKDVGLAGILLYVPTEIVTAPGRTAWTDGRKMYFAEAYFRFNLEEQVAVAIHEALHVALRHVQRGWSLRAIYGAEFDQRTWNIACDAVINQSIRACRWCALPAGAWYPEDCLLGEQLKQRPAQIWTAEEVYAAILDNQRQHGKLLSKAFEGDLVETQSSESTHETALERGIWRERLVRAQAGSAPGSVLRRIAADVPRPTVRWEAVLRNFLTVRLMLLTEVSWQRPSRRTLALGTEAVWIEPGTDRKRGIRRAGVVIDTSGSIDDDLLRRFLAEINSLMVKTGCEVVLIDCDAAIQQVSTHRTPIRGYVAKGGGGTDFRPAMGALSRFPLDVAVYFTDLLGTFPERQPPFPLLWASTQDLPVPFGRKLLLLEKGYRR